MLINEHVLKPRGSAYLPEGLELDKNYTITMEADVTSVTQDKNENGTMDVIYHAKLLTATVQKENGDILKSMDKRKLSQKLRSAIWYHWNQEDTGMDFDSYYNQTMGKLINEIDEVLIFVYGK